MSTVRDGRATTTILHAGKLRYASEKAVVESA
jgi:hypothetical protein